MKRTTTFTRGSGCYKCSVCGRSTRDDGHRDSVHNRQCTQCYALAGMDNMFLDGDALEGDAREALALIAELQDKGADTGEWDELAVKARKLIGGNNG